MMENLKEYQKLLKEVDRCCGHLLNKYSEHINCVKGCPGNCCRIHISVFPVAAAFIVRALHQLPGDTVRHIQEKARQTGTWGPCPLLEKGACLLYDARTILCRTHGLPILSEYRGHRTIGFCQMNFKHLPEIPERDAINLARLNQAQWDVNQRFLLAAGNWFPTSERLRMGEALLLNIPSLTESLT